MDQTTFEDKVFLRDVGKCGKDPNLDSDFSICPGGDSEKAAETTAKSLHNFTDFECQFI